MAKKKAEAVEDSGTEIAIASSVDILVAPASPFAFNTNLAELKKTLEDKLKKYKGMKVTDANFDQCKLVLKECVTLRNMIENRRKESVKAYIDLPKERLNAEFDLLMKPVSEVESGLSEQFDVYEQERRDDLTAVLQEYIDKFQEEFCLSEPILTEVQLKKGYYNKTAKEVETVADIKQQFVDLKKRQDQQAADESMIRKACGDNKLLNPEHWIKQLQYSTLSAVLMEIDEEKDRLSKASEEKEEKPATVSIGLPPDSFKMSKEPKKTMRISITYPESKGAILKKFFADNPEIVVTQLK